MTWVAETAMRQRRLLCNVVLVMAFFGLSALTGVVRNMLIAQRFGLAAELDAYYAAFKLPDLLFAVIGGGALSTVFIPVFVSFLSGGHEGRPQEPDLAGAWQLASDVTNLVVLATGGASIVAAAFAPSLVHHFIAPGFNADDRELTVQLMRILLISVPIFAVSSVQTSVLHAFQHFFSPALAPVLYTLGVIFGAIWLAPRWGVHGLAVGAVIGAVFHLVVKLPWLLRVGLRWQPTARLGNPAVHRILLLMGPRVLDIGAFHLTFLVIANLASRLGPGSVSALEWGWDAMQLPETVIGTAFGLVALPTLADLATRGDHQAMRSTLGAMLRMALTLSLPAACGLVMLGRPLLQLLYQRGAFDEAATQAVYAALVCFAFGLAAHVSLELVARTFFALQDTITPLLIATASSVVNVGLGFWLMGPLRHGGLALANSLAVSAEVLVLLFILRRRLGGIQGRQTLRLLVKSLAACGIMAVAVWATTKATEGLRLGPTILLGSGTAVGIAVYVAAGLMLRIETIPLVPTLLFRRTEADR